MLFTRRKGIKQDGKPVTREFTLRGEVQSMRISELPTDGREICIIELYTPEPVMTNGETGHFFHVYIPNYHTNPRFNPDRMKFWLCYGHQQPVRLNANNEPYVPLIDEEDCNYFTRRTLSFAGQIIQLEDGKEVLELSYLPRD